MCREKFPWRVRAKRLSDGKTIQISKTRGEHTYISASIRRALLIGLLRQLLGM